MLKSMTIPWKGLAVLAIVSILLAACTPAGQAPTTGSSELATPESGTGAEQIPTLDVGQAPLQPTEAIAQAPTVEATAEAATEAPTTAAATEAPTTEVATEAPTTTAAIEAPTTAAGALQSPTLEATTAATNPAATPEATMASSAGLSSTSPAATPVGTPSTLPVTGGSDDGAGSLGLIILLLGAAVLLSAFGLAAMARRPR